MSLFNSTYKGKRVFITGHTGFKGSWLALWMKKMGAEIAGYSLAPSTSPNHFSELNIDIESSLLDIRNKENLVSEIEKFQPDIVFHLAAQPLVRYSYREPSETYETNVIGTLNVLEACRKVKSVSAIICVTTDKVYKNQESPNGYSENDILGGYDPYSSSKACAEILTASYVNSFFNIAEYGKSHNTLVATARGGNVIGGGDWSEDRLIPDIIRATKSNSTLDIRSPKSVRPWQHVLDCLSGYILLGQRLLEKKTDFAEAWNFGPTDKEFITVQEIIDIAQKFNTDLEVKYGEADLHETGMLQLNCQKATEKLNWQPIWDTDEMFTATFDWYHKFNAKNTLVSENQLSEYIEKAQSRNIEWAQ